MKLYYTFPAGHADDFVAFRVAFFMARISRHLHTCSTEPVESV